MSKSYIVETDDETQLIVEIGVNSTGAALIATNPVSFLTPYTEPDTEQVRKEAYDKGYQDANVKISSNEQAIAEKAYQRGLIDAWDAARKIIGDDIPTSYLVKMFGNDPYSVICRIFDVYSASEAIKKIRQYEQEQKDFKVGDEVISDEDIKGVTVDMDDYLLHVLDENGVIQAWPREDAVKTGRYFPEIAEVLRKMQEEKE